MACPETEESVWSPSAGLSPLLPSAQDSPTNKLLYAKEIPEYRKIVQRYYKQIHDMTPLSEQEITRTWQRSPGCGRLQRGLVGVGLGPDFQGRAVGS